jgi:hypothetical protein
VNGIGSSPVRIPIGPRSRALVAALALGLAACGSPTTAPTPPVQSFGPMTEPPIGPTGGPVTSTPPGTEAPTTEAPPTEGPVTTPLGSPAPGSSPSVDSLKVKRTADCLATNGTSSVGYVTITWTASGTTGVRISIDPPSPDVAYDYGFDDYPASGSAEVPFACDPPNHDATGDYHLYVVTTLHDKGYFFYRFAKVYQVAASPAP